MGRHWSYEHVLKSGRTVGYGLIDVGGTYRIRFVGPEGRKAERATGATTKGDARTRARDIIETEYTPVTDGPRAATWEDALEYLARTPDLRPDSIRGYSTAVRAVRRALPTLAGPGDVTPALAETFKRVTLSGTFRRGKAADAASYGRSPTTCTTYLRCLRSLWAKHWRPAGIVTANPWKEVPYPNAPRGRRVRATDDDTVKEFFSWLGARYPEWDAPALWYQVKILTGCRTLDLCKAKAADLRPDGIHLSATAAKTRAARTVKLPPAIVERLRKVAGPEWLWEATVAESKVHRPSVRTHARSDYDPRTWFWTVANLAREFNESRPGKPRLRPHDLRARTATIVAREAGEGAVDLIAQSLGMDPQTARHYVDAAKAWGGPAPLERAAATLLPD